MESTSSINRAFSKQSSRYDEEDRINPIIQRMRSQTYSHVAGFIKPNSKILELNAGTGIDALHFIRQGHAVHAVDLSDGMIARMQQKREAENISNKFTIQQLSFDALNNIKCQKFDYVFSNFGGLNCIRDLRDVTRHLPGLLNSGAYVTFVIMPVVCPWEIAGMVRHGRQALRRFQKGGVSAHLEGEYFQTYYHSLQQIKLAFDRNYQFCKTEGLAALSPQPHRSDFPDKHPSLDKLLMRLDKFARTHFPFDRWADHIIVTFQFNPGHVNIGFSSEQKPAVSARPI